MTRIITKNKNECKDKSRYRKTRHFDLEVRIWLKPIRQFYEQTLIIFVVSEKLWTRVLLCIDVFLQNTIFEHYLPAGVHLFTTWLMTISIYLGGCGLLSPDEVGLGNCLLFNIHLSLVSHVDSPLLECLSLLLWTSVKILQRAWLYEALI